MRPAQLLKIVLLFVALFMVFGIMRGLDAVKMQGFFENLGIEAGGAGSPGFQPGGRPLAPGEERFNICRTRVHAVDWPDNGRKVEEQKDGLKLTWAAFDPKPREMSYLEMEKWLSQHCQIAVRAIGPEVVATISARRKLVIRYIDGTAANIQWIDGKYFEIDGKLLESKDFADALIELERLALFRPVLE